MGSIPKNSSVPSAVTNYCKLDLSCQHITTSNFMEFNCAKSLELVPKQSINVDMSTFTRLAPMPVPTFGNADLHNVAYFVPYRTIMRGWNEFINDTTYSGDIIPVVPQISNAQLVSFLLSPSCAVDVTDEYLEERDKSLFDIEYLGNSLSSYYRLTAYGKWVYKILRSLGYGLAFDSQQSGFYHSALPLLALVKVYYDWYYPTAYVDDDRSNQLRKWLEYDPTNTTAFIDAFTSQDIAEVFNVIHRVCYDSDYYVSAWDNPVAPNSGAYSDVDIKDPTSSNPNYNIGGLNNVNGTPEINANSTLTQYAIDALKAVNDYMTRHRLAGARVLDRYLARWGVKLPDANLNRSILLSEGRSKIQFGDVTSTSDTVNGGNGAPLGSYAGKGVGYNGNLKFDFSTEEFGMLIVVSTIVPKTAYYQGADRATFRLSRFDFYTPEFDTLGVQALATRELYVPVTDYSQRDTDSGLDADNAVFGFVPRYADYKRGRDMLTGDYVLSSKNVGKEGWTLMRDMRPWFDGRDEGYANVVHSQNFVEGDDANQYNRIFYITDNEEDKFNVIHNFVIDSRFPGKSLYDSYEFKDENKAAKSSIDINGVRMN